MCQLMKLFVYFDFLVLKLPIGQSTYLIASSSSEKDRRILRLVDWVLSGLAAAM